MTSITDYDDDDQRRHQRRRSSDQPAPMKIVGQAVVAISIVGSIFAAGYSWRSVAILESERGDYVRKDVHDQQLQRVTDRLGEISAQLQEVRSELGRQRR